MTERLLLVVTAWETVLVVLLSPFSATGPLASLELPARLGIVLDEAARTGRIVLLYHSLAVPFVAALVYLILDLLPFEAWVPRIVRPAITAGYMLASAGGIGFAYLGAGWIAHGLFLVGLSLVLYAGLVLCVALFPRRGGDGSTIERFAFWLMALCTLISVVIGGATGAFFGNGFSAFLAEDVIRLAHDLGQRAIIAHLHILLTLIDIALLLIVARTSKLAGRAHTVAMLLVIVGTIVTSLATWSVMIVDWAHKVINVGAVILLAGAAVVAVQGFTRIVRERLAAQGIARASATQKVAALLHDPVRLGIFFELLFVNLVVTGPGVYVALHLETYRQPVFLEVERTIAVGHWHVLATLSAVIALLLVMDRLQVGGALRRWVGWGVLAGSTLGFVAVQFFMFRRPDQAVTWPLPLIDIGIGLVLTALVVLLGAWVAGLAAPNSAQREV